MSSVELPGCRLEPVGSYLQGLGLFRCVARSVDRGVRAHWQAGSLVLTTSVPFGPAELIAQLVERFEPLPIVSPWNSGSGFAANGKSATAERVVQRVRESHEPRLAALRQTVSAADTVVAEGRRRGWAGMKGELWDKARKPDVLALARNTLPDDALPWMDAAIVLGAGDDPVYSRLLGTGGNFGRQDLSVTYLQRAFTVLDNDGGREWLSAALTGAEDVRYQRDTVGQFDPGRAGGVQSSPWETDSGGFVNPWSFLLTTEGALLFASAVVRRMGALTSHAAVPFTVRSSPVGYASSAVDENVMAELWAPVWPRPATLPEVEKFFGEARADWRGSPARSGLDFVRALASLGVDRGVPTFTRHLFVERLGQNPLAVPAGRVEVEPRPAVTLLSGLDGWLGRLRGDLPRAVAGGLRELDEAQYALAAGRGASALHRVLIGLGRLHETVARSGAGRDAVGTPLLLSGVEQWLAAMGADIAELRLAAALASGRDGSARDPGMTVRSLLIPEQRAAGQRPQWTDRPIVSWGGGVVDGLAAVHRRRSQPGVVPEPNAAEPPAVKGVLSGFRFGSRLPLGDLIGWTLGELDDDLVGDYLKGFLLFDWSAPEPVRLPALRRDGPPPILRLPRELGLLAPFFAATPLMLRRDQDELRPSPVSLRPGGDWIPLLLADRIAEVVADATRRLRIAGIVALPGAPADLDGRRLVAALLVPISRTARERMLHAVTSLPTFPARELAQSEGVSA